MKILVVEDEPDLNHIIAKHLQAEGYIVDSCFNGNDAVYYITEESYDAISPAAPLPGIFCFVFIFFKRDSQSEN